jgi:hypothetical protein
MSSLWSRIVNFWHQLSVVDSTMLVLSPWRRNENMRLTTRSLEVMTPEHPTPANIPACPTILSALCWLTVDSR